MKIPAVKGFHDVLPGECARWAMLEARARQTFERYHFGEIRIPVVERTDLFRRSIGETTDIVEKEMYTFDDRDATSVTLRPEGTASVVRAYVQNALHVAEPVSKLYYMGPMFRRERPQKGRLRQFSQIGAEVLGRDDAAADAEVLVLLYDLLAAFEIDNAEVQINSLGCRECRPPYRELLVAWGRQHQEEICADCKRRIEENPLRLLDCKQPGCRAIRDTAPRMLDQCCDACRKHFEQVRSLLDAEGIRPPLAPYMVRGLDYYCRTAFEILAPGLGAQNAIGGGGRYDGLVHELGGPDVAGVGFALGMERLVLALEDREFPSAVLEFFVAPLGENAETAAIQIAHRLRGEGARVEVESGGKSLKSQMRRAGKLGARFVLILGDEEIASQEMTIRDMEARQDHKRAVSFRASLAEIRAQLATRTVAAVEEQA
jgi:histidyl-tRNA synthetase